MELELEELRKKAVYQNTIDTWIAVCGEKNIDWYEIENYEKFIAFLTKSGLKMQKFPLCVKESGGTYERGRDKTKFAEILSESNDLNKAAYTIKLNDTNLKIIRQFSI